MFNLRETGQETMESAFLTTREVAALLRVKERKIYDLVAEGALPVRRVTGKLLFPRKEIDQWIHQNTTATHRQALDDRPSSHRPLVMAGGHDPLLEWALRESRSGIAAFLDGALDGLERAGRGDCVAAGLHIPDLPSGTWNIAAVEDRFAAEPWVLIEWAHRTRGLIVNPAVKKPIRDIEDVKKLRFQARQPEAGSELILTDLLRQAGMLRADLNLVATVERSESDLALAIASGRADVGLGIEASARQLQLEFVPLVRERFDLLVWRKAYFDPPFQKLVRFCSTSGFFERARILGGYDVEGFGTVHFNAS
jgi:putative molybdopterin biosynthesis protein